MQLFDIDAANEASPHASIFEEVIVLRKPATYTAGKILKGMLGPTPISILNYTSPRAAETLAATLAKSHFDAVQIENPHLYAYTDVIRAAPGRPTLLLDWHNIESELMYRYSDEVKNVPKKIVARRTAKLLQDAESRLIDRCDAHSVVSEREKTKLLQRNPAAHVHVLPNGVDTSTYRFSETTSSQSSLLFVGSMDYHANVDAVTWFAESTWPAISSAFPELEFVVVGRSPGRDVQKLASDTVRITGTVDDVRPYYASALAVVVPLRVGGGTRLKILEAMSMGVPVISTTLGAEGISVTNETNIILADSEQEIIRAVERLVREPELRQRLAHAGRKLVSDHYDWDAIGSRLYQVHTSLLEYRVRS